LFPVSLAETTKLPHARQNAKNPPTAAKMQRKTDRPSGQANFMTIDSKRFFVLNF
jgi:hypothetical protein